MMRIFLIVLMLFVCCTAQRKIDSRTSVNTVCWGDSDHPPGTTFAIFYKQYQTTDTIWKLLSSEQSNIAKITRPGFGKHILGVVAIYNGDTSDIHSSLDSTACLEGACDGECTSVGAWYINWRITGVKFLRVEK